MIPLWVKLTVAGAICALAAVYHVIEVKRSYTAGEMAERVAWQDQRLRDIAKREAERKVAEAKISEIENRYLASRQENEAKMADLEKALAEERADAPDNPACPPAISRRVRDQLQNIR